MGFYTGKDYIDVCEKVCTILYYEGAGHTFSMHTKDDKMVDYFAKRVPASRIMVNTPSALGGIGATTNLQPALTLGCGAVGGSATSENVGPLQLLNYRYVAYGQRELEDIKAQYPGLHRRCMQRDDGSERDRRRRDRKERNFKIT